MIFFKIKNIIQNIKRGFTLVETLVAISILLVAVVAPLTLITSNISSAFGVKDKIAALYLAEDAIDYVKYKIATNFNDGNPNWLLGLDPCVGGGACRVDSFNNDIASCGGTCPVLQFYPITGAYGYDPPSVDSKFTRTVTIVSASQDPNPTTPFPDEVVITVTVEWQDHGIPKQTIISEHAFAWGI